MNILVLGDSYVHGQCVNNKTNLIGQMNELGKKAIGLGIYGNGPLMEYATLIEYDQNFKYDTLVWVFTPDNDFYDLSLEKNEPILLNYINLAIKRSFNKFVASMPSSTSSLSWCIDFSWFPWKI